MVKFCQLESSAGTYKKKKWTYINTFGHIRECHNQEKD